MEYLFHPRIEHYSDYSPTRILIPRFDRTVDLCMTP
nr:MAG TPA: hypothetical protein [Caudoviricetes sp.]